MKPILSFFVLAFWISSWFPTTGDRWAVLGAAFCILGLFAAFLAKPYVKERKWPAKITVVLALAGLVCGVLLSVAVRAVGTPVDGAMTLFHVLGGVAYLWMIAGVLTPETVQTRRSYLGRTALLGLAAWSWGSATAMYLHLGAAEDTQTACILVPRSLAYDTEVRSVWRMRLPEIASNRTGQTGMVILNYHAVLVVPSSEGARIYNWSKRRLRFETLDPQRNPYVPMDCPDRK